MNEQEWNDKWLDAPERLARLTEKQLVAFLLVWVGFSQEEVGAAFGVSKQAISCRLKAANKRLQSFERERE